MTHEVDWCSFVWWKHHRNACIPKKWRTLGQKKERKKLFCGTPIRSFFHVCNVCSGTVRIDALKECVTHITTLYGVRCEPIQNSVLTHHTLMVRPCREIVNRLSTKDVYAVAHIFTSIGHIAGVDPTYSNMTRAMCKAPYKVLVEFRTLVPWAKTKEKIVSMHVPHTYTQCCDGCYSTVTNHTMCLQTCE